MRTFTFSLALLLAACGSSGGGPDGPGDGGTSGTDGAAPDDARPSDADAPDVTRPGRDGSADSSMPADGDTSPDGGAGECGTDEVDPLTELPRSCRDRPECYDDPRCVEAQLEADGRGDYTECGEPVTFDPSSSDAVCMAGPPFGDWDTPFMCNVVDYAGRVRFFCSPDGSIVLVRFSGVMTPPPDAAAYYPYLGHEYWTGSGFGSGGGGSGYAYSVATPRDGVPADAFVGFEPVERTGDGSGGFEPFDLTIWFLTGALGERSYVAGGLSVRYPDDA